MACACYPSTSNTRSGTTRSSGEKSRGFAPDKSRPVRILLVGVDSDEYIAAERSNRKRAVESMKKQLEYSPEEADRLSAETLTACTKSWENLPLGWVEGSESEEPAPHTRDNALALYENDGVSWLYTQVDEFIGKRARFLKA